MVRTWVPIYAGTEVAGGRLAVGAATVAVTVTAERATNMISQLLTGRLSDAHGLVAVCIPLSPTIGGALETGVTVPVLWKLPPAYLPLIAFSGLLGVVDSFREPASMALFADEGTDDGGVASSFGIRELVWRPGSVAGPLIAGWLMVEVSVAAVFYVIGAFAVTGAVALLGLLAREHGRGSLLHDYADEQQSADDQQQQRYLRPRTIDALVAVSQHPHDRAAGPCRAFGAGLLVLQAVVLSHATV